MAFFNKTKVSIEADLRKRIDKHIEEEGFSSLQEFVIYCIEKELGSTRETDEDKIAGRLRGLGYIE